MINETKENVQKIESMTIALETLRKGEIINAPNYQRVSANGTIQRLKAVNTKKFKCEIIEAGINGYFTIKRIK